ncbi:hypothetical protein [Acidocella sp.]
MTGKIDPVAGYAPIQEEAYGSAMGPEQLVIIIFFINSDMYYA